MIKIHCLLLNLWRNDYTLNGMPVSVVNDSSPHKWSQIRLPRIQRNNMPTNKTHIA